MTLSVPLSAVMSEPAGVSPAMLKIIAAVTLVSLALGVIQRMRHEVGA